MSRPKKETIFGERNRLENPKALIMMIILLVIVLFFTSYDDKGIFKREEFIFGSSVVLVSGVLIYIFAFRKNLRFSKQDKDILVLSIEFLRMTENSESDIRFKLHMLFSSYDHKQLFKLIKKYYKEKPDFLKASTDLSIQTSEIKYYALYSLMDLASSDRLYSIKEEEFIDKVRQLMKVPLEDFQSVKEVYLNKGLQEEREVLEEFLSRSWHIKCSALLRASR
jgi:amino acid permease